MLEQITSGLAADLAISTAFVVITMRELFGLIRWLIDRKSDGGSDGHYRSELRKISKTLGEIDRRTQAIENQLGITASKTESLENARERLFEKVGSLEGRTATLEGRLSSGGAAGGL